MLSKDKISRLSFAGAALFLSGLAFLFLKHSEPRIRSVRDLYFIRGTFREYTWRKFIRGSTLTMRLNEYGTLFQVKADFYSSLNKKQLDRVGYGDPVEIAIAAGDQKNFERATDRVLIYSFTSGDKNILDVKGCMATQNSDFMYVTSGGFILLGCVFFFIARQSRRRRPLGVQPD